MAFIFEGQRPKVLRVQVDGKDGYVLLLDQDSPKEAIYFSSWQGDLMKWVSELSLIVGQTPPQDLSTLDDHLQKP